MANFLKGMFVYKLGAKHVSYSKVDSISGVMVVMFAKTLLKLKSKKTRGSLSILMFGYWVSSARVDFPFIFPISSS